MPLPVTFSSQAARLVSISRDAKRQSEEAIRASLRLLRQPTYPHDPCPDFAADDTARIARPER